MLSSRKKGPLGHSCGEIFIYDIQNTLHTPFYLGGPRNNNNKRVVVTHEAFFISGSIDNFNPQMVKEVWWGGEATIIKKSEICVCGGALRNLLTCVTFFFIYNSVEINYLLFLSTPPAAPPPLSTQLHCLPVLWCTLERGQNSGSVPFVAGWHIVNGIDVRRHPVEGGSESEREL
jgi:hypothetical protein